MINPKDINSVVERAKTTAEALLSSGESANALRTCLACTDYTTLKETDTPASVTALAKEALALAGCGLPPVASVCVYPSLVDAAGVALGDSEIGITAVCGGFPSGQTYAEVKVLECAMAVENGADEVDIVINVGAILSGEYDIARSEIEMIRQELGDDALLKVILETGSLGSSETIAKAATIALEAGADFIKTSTGKTPVSATPEAAAVMCRALEAFLKSTGQRKGIKVAGGIKTPGDALLYYCIVRETLGEAWLNPQLFRIGASDLVKNIEAALA